MMAMRQRKMKRRWAQRVLPARAEMASWAAAKRPPLETTGAMAMSGVAGWMIWWRARRIQASSKPRVRRKIPARDMSAAQRRAAAMRVVRMRSARVCGEGLDMGLQDFVLLRWSPLASLRACQCHPEGEDLRGLLFGGGYQAAVFVVVADVVLWVGDVGGQDQEVWC